MAESESALLERFVRAGDAEAVIACFLPDGQDYSDVERMLAAEPGDEGYDIRMVMQSLDPDAEMPIVSTAANPDGSVKIIWLATFESEASMEGHTFLAGDRIEIDSLLVESGDSWLIDGM